MGKIERIQVAPEDREWLVKLVKDRNTPQKIACKALAQAAFALSLALYAHFGLVAQHGRAVLCRDHQKTHSPRRLQERRRIEASHHGLSQSPQRQPEALRLDKDRRRNLQ